MSYYKILGLDKEPFSTSPDPAFFFLSKEHKAAFFKLQIALSLRRGLCVVLGDVGTGKTTLSRKLSQVLSGNKDVIFRMILNPYFESEKQFICKLATLFHVDVPENASTLQLIEAFERYLFNKGVEEQKTVVLLIDEAQILPDYVLETLRILLNYETNEYKMLQLVLVGQMELLPRISKMNNFWDRIALKCMINPLGHEAMQEVINYRLHQAGYKGRDPLFTEDAVNTIYEHTKGYPRKITLVCHDCLEGLVMFDKRTVDEDLVRQVIESDVKPVMTEISDSDIPEDDTFIEAKGALAVL